MEHADQSINPAFIPVIFDENDSDFIMNSIQRFGNKHKDQVDVVPETLEHPKFEVTDEAMAGFVRSCLLTWSDWSERLMIAHDKAAAWRYEYGRPPLSLKHQMNVRNSIAEATHISETAKQLVERLTLNSVEV